VVFFPDRDRRVSSVLLLQFLNAVLLPGIGLPSCPLDGVDRVFPDVFSCRPCFWAMLSPFAIALLHAREARPPKGPSGKGIGGLVFFLVDAGQHCGQPSPRASS